MSPKSPGAFIGRTRRKFRQFRRALSKSPHDEPTSSVKLRNRFQPMQCLSRRLSSRTRLGVRPPNMRRRLPLACVCKAGTSSHTRVRCAATPGKDAANPPRARSPADWQQIKRCRMGAQARFYNRNRHKSEPSASRPQHRTPQMRRGCPATDGGPNRHPASPDRTNGRLHRRSIPPLGRFGRPRLGDARDASMPTMRLRARALKECPRLPGSIA